MRAPVLHSVMFDPLRRAATPELKAAIKSLIAFLEQREADLAIRQRARKDADRRNFHLAIEAIACNLAGLALTGLDWPLAVPRSSGVMWSKGRYNVPAYGQHFVDALDLMAQPRVGLVEDLSRGYSFAGGHKQRSTIRPTPAFDDRVRPALTGWESFLREEEPEVLILKRPKDHSTGRATAIDYPETAHTRSKRKDIRRINAILEKAPLRLVMGDSGDIALTEDGQPIDPTRRAVRRIFNNGNWREGGRLYDGFWETMRRADRFRFLRICTPAHPEGERIANVDFSQLFPTLVYHYAKCRFRGGDLYDIFGDGSSREGWKKLVNALLFADGPMTRWPEGTSPLFPKGTKLADALARVRKVHAPISHLFGTAIGFKLMFTESTILIEALGRLNNLGVTALPLHDSVLVAVSDAAAAKRVMEDVFGMFFVDDARAKLKVDLGEQYQ